MTWAQNIFWCHLVLNLRASSKEYSGSPHHHVHPSPLNKANIQTYICMVHEYLPIYPDTCQIPQTHVRSLLPRHMSDLFYPDTCQIPSTQTHIRSLRHMPDPFYSDTCQIPFTWHMSDPIYPDICQIPFTQSHVRSHLPWHMSDPFYPDRCQIYFTLTHVRSLLPCKRQVQVLYWYSNIHYSKWN